MVIDTSIFIEFLRAKQKDITTLYNLPENNRNSLSSVTLFELYMGATSPVKENDILKSTDELTILPFTDEIAVKAGQIYLTLRKKNQIIDFRDIFIAATCVVHDLPLVTLNKKHFERVDGLVLFEIV